MFEGRMDRVRETRPLVHCITNYVTAGDCANALLAVGASPIMADAPEEAEEITARCRALVLNLGTLSQSRLSAMCLAGKRANELGHPVVFDPVGVGASVFRKEGAKKLLEQVKFSAIRGNISEILALAGNDAGFGGVDVEKKDAQADIAQRKQLAAAFSRQTGAAVAITGERDVVSNGSETLVIRGGHPMMGQITGVGCVLSCLIGAFLAAAPEEPLEAVAAAVGAMAVCGKRAYEKAAHAGRGTGSYRAALMDELSLFNQHRMEEIRLGD